MATHANSTTAPAFQVLQVCRQCAAEIRDAAKTAEPGALDDADRASLLVLADLIEIRAGYKVDLRPTLECALDGAIGLLDAADGEVDLEEGHDAELDFEGEATLGAPEQHHNQTKWAAGWSDHDGEAELSLGAPERHPWVLSPSSEWFGDCGRHVARGGCNSQLQWALGSRKLERDEGEAEPGYDLPEGDDERCDSDKVEAEHSLGWAANVSQLALGENTADGDLTAPERFGRGFVRCGPDDYEAELDGDQSDGEPYLSVVEWKGDGCNWGRNGNATTANGTDIELVNEDGGDEHYEAAHV